MNETRLNKSEFSWLSLTAAALLFAVGIAYMAWPFLSMSLDDEIQQYPQGYDLWTYYMGSRAFYEHEADPYENIDFKELVQSGALRSDHPDQSYDEKALAVIGDGVMNGYLGSPVIMLIFRAFRPIGFYRLQHMWPFISLFFIALPLLLLAKRFLIAQQDRPSAKAAKYLWIINLLIWNRAFWVHSILHGQIDVLYVAPSFFAIYLFFAYSEENSALWGTIGAAALVALAACIKVFPAIIVLAFFWVGIIRWIDTRKRGAPQLWRGNAPMQKALLSGAFALAFILIAAVSIGLFDGSFFDLLASWRMKLSASLYHPTLVYRQNNPHMAPFLSNYLLYLTRIWLRLWEMVGEGAIRTVATGISLCVALSIFALSAMKRTKPKFVITLFIAAAPTLLMHWWNYYNTFLLIAFIILFASARALENSRRRIGIYAALVTSYILMMANYVTIGDAFPWLAKFINGHELEFLRFELTPYNLLFGYPGAFILLVAAALVCMFEDDAVVATGAKQKV